MSTAPSHLIQLLHGEIRELEQARRTLEHALAEARRGEERTTAALAAARKKIVDSTHQAVPDPADAAIPRRITAALDAACSAATRALTNRWGQIRALIKKALTSVLGELDKKTRMLRRLEAELLRGKHADHGRGLDPSQGGAGAGGAGAGAGDGGAGGGGGSSG